MLTPKHTSWRFGPSELTSRQIIRRVVHGFHHRLKVLPIFLLHLLDELVGRNLNPGHC